MKKNNEIDFLQTYLDDYSKLITPNLEILIKLKKVKDELLNTSKKGGKILIF